MKYELREMTSDDIPDIVKAEKQIFGSSLGFDMFFAELKMNPFAHYFVLEIDNRIGGLIGSWIESDHAEIIDFYVLEEYRHLGFGSMMLEFLIELVRESKVPDISLEVREHNEEAKRLYRKHGFRYAYTRKNYYQDGEDALVMILEVENAGSGSGNEL